MNTETLEIWLANLKEKLIAVLEQEADDTIGAIENERIWAAGSPDDVTTDMHNSNIEDLEEYNKLIKTLRAHIDDFKY